MQTRKTLTKLRLIGWHYFNNETINFKNVNLFSGENGAGKSTILDAIQFVLTTNSRKFNLAANAESKRNLRSYVRGKTGEEGNEYLRQGSVISYVALEIHEEESRRDFVIGAKLDSPDFESNIRPKWFCEAGKLEDLTFIVDNKPARDEQFKNNGKKVNFIYQPSMAKDKFKARMGHLQDNFFELLAKSMAFKPMNNVKSFVSQFILPQKDVDTAALKENINSANEMQLLVDELKKQADTLKGIKDIHDSILHIDEQILVIDILIKIAESEVKNEKIGDLTKQISTEKQLLMQNEKLFADTESENRALNERYTGMLAALRTGETAQIINQLNIELLNKNKDKEILSADIKKLKDQLKRIKKALPYIPENGRTYAECLIHLEQGEKDIAYRNDTIITLESIFSSELKNVRSSITTVAAKKEALAVEMECLSVEIKDLERNKITYDKNVTSLKEAIEREFAARGINSKVYILSDLLEISDTRWQNAVEGYLNTQRFHIIVEPEFYDIAAEVYDRNKTKIHTAAVVNTGKLDIAPVCGEKSLASVIESQNRYAYAYACYILGRVTMCENVSELKQHNISITPDCMLYQGKALRKINPRDYSMPYIGKYALQQQLVIKKSEYDEKHVQKTENDEQLKLLEEKQSYFENCNFEIAKEVISRPLEIKKVKADIEELNKKLKDAQNDPTYIQLQIEADELKKQLDLKGRELNALNLAKHDNKNRIKQLSENIKQLELYVEEIMAEISSLSLNNDSALSEAEKKFEERKKTKSADSIFANYQPQKQKLINQKNAVLLDLVSCQTKYKDGELGTGIEMMKAYNAEYEAIIKHDLVGYEEKLRVLKDNCETEFRENFLAKMRENIENAQTLFKDLNKSLKTVYYGNDSYRFDYAPEKDKKRLYDMIMSDFNLGGFNLFSAQFDKEYHDEMEELFSKLTVSDEKGEDVIAEYTDYRTYLDYDIEIISKDGRRQKFSKIYREKSGGETQTPYYVAIAASFAQIYSAGETVRIIMLDEAFDKMDEERIKSMITFFKSYNFQIILAAPTSRLELIGEEADNIIMIYTDSSHNSFSEEFSYDEL